MLKRKIKFTETNQALGEDNVREGLTGSLTSGRLTAWRISTNRSGAALLIEAMLAGRVAHGPLY